MKTLHDSRPRASRGFTLIELLVVISIIGVLAGMILPALARAKVSARVAQAKVEMASIRTAINQYEADYHRYPASEIARGSLTDDQCPDFTFGTFYRVSGAGYRLMNGAGRLALPVVDNSGQRFAYQTSNAELMAALCDILVFRNDEQTPNRQRTPSGEIVDHVLNPRKQRYLDVKEVDSPKQPGRPATGGLGFDGVYRDPFGNPYIISLDMNFDGRCRDAFYRMASVSADATGKGINGLSRPVGVNAGNFFEANAPIMIWSFGPDGTADVSQRANLGVNKDNIISW